MGSDDAFNLFVAVERQVSTLISNDQQLIAPLLLMTQSDSAQTRTAGRRTLYDYVGAVAEPVITKYHDALADVAAEQYAAERTDAGIADTYTPVTAALTVDQGSLTGALIKGGPDLLETRMNYAIRDGYNQTVMANSRNDARSAGWARNAEPGACWFCLMLSSRGFVYYTQKSASFAPHNSCRCQAVSIFDTASLTSVAKFQGNVTAKFTPTERATGRGTPPDAETQRRYAQQANSWATANGLTDLAVA